MPSIFSRIVAGEIPCHKVAENDHCLAFLDIQPIAVGHTLVIPKKEVDLIWDLDAETYGHLHSFAREVAIKLKKVVPCIRVGSAVIGLEVPHAHIHLVPMNKMSDISFQGERVQMTHDQLAALAEQIRKA